MEIRAQQAQEGRNVLASASNTISAGHFLEETSVAVDLGDPADPGRGRSPVDRPDDPGRTSARECPRGTVRVAPDTPVPRYAELYVRARPWTPPHTRYYAAEPAPVSKRLCPDIERLVSILSLGYRYHKHLLENIGMPTMTPRAADVN